MKSRGVVGKRIARIVQRNYYDEYLGGRRVSVLSIVLEDGTEIRPYATPTDCGESTVDFVVVKPKRGEGQ